MANKVVSDKWMSQIYQNNQLKISNPKKKNDIIFIKLSSRHLRRKGLVDGRAAATARGSPTRRRQAREEPFEEGTTEISLSHSPSTPMNRRPKATHSRRQHQLNRNPNLPPICDPTAAPLPPQTVAQQGQHRHARTKSNRHPFFRDGEHLQKPRLLLL